MPIYAYKCESCGHRQDVLQKVSDPVLGTCPACGSASFAKQVTAAGFQLKGSGWYATDFRGNKPQADQEKTGQSDKADKATEPGAKSADAAASEAKPAAPAPSPKASKAPTEST